jgi:hypothetical protein
MAQTFRPGIPVTYISESTAGPFAAVFEDNGGIAFFYALDTDGAERILDALLIYNAHSGLDREQDSALEIQWSADGWKAMLTINGAAHAIFDFAEKIGSCRTNIPGPRQWRREPWVDVA